MSNSHFPSTQVLALAAGLAVLVTEATLFHAMSADLPIWGLVLGFFFFGALMALPHGLLLFFGRRLETRLTRWLVLAGMAAALLFWLAAWYATFVDNSNPDAQDGIVFVVVPVIATIGAMILAVLAGALDRMLAR